MNQKKIAQLASVSASTVSKALSGSSEVSKETAERIRQIAIDVGYFKEKSKRKREYANDGAFLIAVIVPEIMGFHYATIVTCIKDQVEARGGHIAVYIDDFDSAKGTKILESIILHGGTDGVIMFSAPELFIRPNIPIVCCCAVPSGKYDSICVCHSKLMDDAVGFLAKQGHKRIGFVGEPHTIHAAENFEKAVQKHGLSFFPEFVYTVRERFEKIGHMAALQILEQKSRPTAVIAAYDEIAIGLMATLTRHGIRVPEDISVMGINNIPSAVHAQIPLTSVQTFSSEQYKTAVDVLFDRIADEARPIKHIIIEHTIFERETTSQIKENCCAREDQ